ncbi:type II toxin-antitoxin system antitoxin, RelB/DinJ family [Rhodospirillum rubrum]|uniref:type II toxin-antitoxin system RelB/DinJ family antitoxin n=1 Tax=Rhodospirillum rubrum TaxID=1085 RepID=UPI0019031FA9|nr:type II toxin-antitoxin system RelB/DinJ family antitoxin [Rhodospirillum rubrum]MBK1665882.1 type II toxin-antitoxin system antitoxin, RelB/DinJ family [Rhodospirillum rubrum]MBK1678003.1 type II toxin-antitoxin system antitoxin, RelB/DinJ family [Rhodospirillum rubrum]
MAATAFIRARIDENLKDEATKILATMGLTVSDFVRIGLTKVVQEKGLPFEMRAPNQLTVETLAKSERGEDLHPFDNADAMFKDLGI